MATTTKQKLVAKMIKAIKVLADKPGGTVKSFEVEKRGDQIIGYMLVEKYVVFNLDGEVVDGPK